MYKAAAAVVCMCLLAGCQSNEKMQTNKPHSQAAANHAKRENHHTKEEKQKKQKAEPRYYINPKSFSVEKMDEQKEKKPIALVTIDDAPDQHAAEIADKLHDLNASAIFFVNGHFLKKDENKKALKHIHELGFMIGNHTMTHQNLKDLSEQKQREEIIGVNKAVEKVIGEKPAFFRAPFGSNTDYSDRLIKKEGMVKMNWTFGYDWDQKYQSKKALTDITLSSPYLRDGANILMHDRKWTAEAMPDIVKGLRHKGYTVIDPRAIKGP
ncbi:polysaccharide deacetylase family protein [Bacillus sp. B38]|uniref:polysaccharide deacetylase family protein n=1 Tax=Bacillus sp. B38 TaxID=218305 RepID=UPI003C7DC4A3